MSIISVLMAKWMERIVLSIEDCCKIIKIVSNTDIFI